MIASRDLVANDTIYAFLVEPIIENQCPIHNSLRNVHREPANPSA